MPALSLKSGPSNELSDGMPVQPLRNGTYFGPGEKQWPEVNQSITFAGDVLPLRDDTCQSAGQRTGKDLLSGYPNRLSRWSFWAIAPASADACSEFVRAVDLVEFGPSA